MDTVTKAGAQATPWNKGKRLGQKPSLKLKGIAAIRIRLQLGRRARELAIFNLAIDSKLRGGDSLGLRVHDVVHGSQVARRAIVMQKKTQRPTHSSVADRPQPVMASDSRKRPLADNGGPGNSLIPRRDGWTAPYRQFQSSSVDLERRLTAS